MSLTNDSSAAETPMRAGSVDGPGPRLSISSILPWLRCPVDGTTLTWDGTQDQISCAHGTHVFPIEADIPCLFAPNEWPEGKRDVTDIVKEFYEKTPFPNYDDLDTRDSLRLRARAGIFGKMLDEQLSHSASILEIGCGIGTDTIMNS